MDVYEINSQDRLEVDTIDFGTTWYGAKTLADDLDKAMEAMAYYSSDAEAMDRLAVFRAFVVRHHQDMFKREKRNG